MTSKITLIIGVAVSALAFGVPTALGEGRLAGSLEPTLAQPDPMIEDGFAQAVAAKKALSSPIVSERIGEPQSLKAERARSEGLNRVYGLGEFAVTNGYVDAHERAVPPTSSTTPVSVTTSGRDVEWPQIGVGFGIGMLLLLGLGLAMRAAHVRPFAH
jgi:hypothetical protein